MPFIPTYQRKRLETTLPEFPSVRSSDGRVLSLPPDRSVYRPPRQAEVRVSLDPRLQTFGAGYPKVRTMTKSMPQLPGTDLFKTHWNMGFCAEPGLCQGSLMERMKPLNLTQPCIPAQLYPLPGGTTLEEVEREYGAPQVRARRAAVNRVWPKYVDSSFPDNTLKKVERKNFAIWYRSCWQELQRVLPDIRIPFADAAFSSHTSATDKPNAGNRYLQATLTDTDEHSAPAAAAGARRRKQHPVDPASFTVAAGHPFPRGLGSIFAKQPRLL